MFLKLIKCVWNFNRFEIYLTVDFMKIGVYALYKVQIILFGTDKMLYGIFSFSCGNTFGLSV